MKNLVENSNYSEIVKSMAKEAPDGKIIVRKILRGIDRHSRSFDLCIGKMNGRLPWKALPDAVLPCGIAIECPRRMTEPSQSPQIYLRFRRKSANFSRGHFRNFANTM